MADVFSLLLIDSLIYLFIDLWTLQVGEHNILEGFRMLDAKGKLLGPNLVANGRS